MSVKYLEVPHEVIFEKNYNSNVYRPGQNQHGYGNKISTDYLVRIGNHVRRVYAICWSNVASHYIFWKKEKVFLKSL